MTDDSSNSAAAPADIAQAAINNKAHLGMNAAGIAHPSVKFMLQHPAHLIALGFGSGLPRVAPGTVGSLWAWLAYLVLALWLSPAQIGWLIAASIPVGWWACTVTAKHMRVADPGHIVWDEVVAMWIVLWLCMPMGFWGQLTCFALFRFFDAVKPQPVKWADRLFKGFGLRGGWGIMWDDLVAAFCTLLVVALWRHFF
ncbi:MULTISPECIES: phosphatidylglycerophosphatase A family protein [Comamonas]|nr:MULTISPECIES: phosphatidylglycerophosphatase A [Comamonas]KGG91502.1 phosphatidylglycerophosphatase [Comamonas thiooxydans]KGG97115.1 phosphatidylglycerophosphatase [Comamonas thiooxydans]KGH05636.1 phosphatidylglycerophosphatase [Comamonas thiooxydans]KGH13502.1 phosphatidylglycerophosphatase [Comamonas thiooxydans]TZG11642.1 phosphatidylglycerophosphatase A [Comamonas thiooxydans]